MKQGTKYSPDEPDEWELPFVLSVRSCHHRSNSVNSRRFAAVSRLPCDLPQRFKGALVSDACVWTRDIKVEVSWRLWPHGSISATFCRSGTNETNLCWLPLYWLTSTFWSIWKGSTSSALGSPSAFWSTTMHFSCPVPLHRKTSISVPNEIWLSHEWKRLD